MKVLSKTELSSSPTSYRIEIEDEDLRTDETSEERYQRYLKQLREARAKRTAHQRNRENPPPTSRA
jgi:hypothetical protein